MSVSLPFVALSMLFGMCCGLCLPNLPAQNWVVLLLVLVLPLLYINNKRLVSLTAFALLGFALLCFHVNQHLHHALPDALEGQKITVIGTISSVVENYKKPNTKFNFDISKVDNNSSAWNLPASVQLSWRTAKKMQPGEQWRLRIKVKSPRNFANPGSFDSERYFFQQRIVGTGYVVDDHANQRLSSNTILEPINNIRQELYAFMHENLATQAFMPILTSLLLGIRSNIPNNDYEIFQATGTSHLLAISGLHLGILATLVFMLLRYMWRFIPKQSRHFSAPSLAAMVSLIVCVLYAFIAGFSIATQRAIIMITVFLAGIIFKRKVSSVNSYSLALLLVILWDPLAIFSFGFWFSFIAVGLLLYARRYKVYAQSPWQKVYSWLQPQIVLSVGLLPCSLLFFAKTASVGSVANLVAIPWISLAVLPLGLLGILFIPLMPELSIALFKLANLSLGYLWPILQKMSALPMYTWSLPDKHMPLIMISAAVGVLWLLAPRGIPGRWLGAFGLAPLLFTLPPSIPLGQADFTLLDVGQGLATVIRTTNHVLVYDTGAKISTDFDLGARVVAPYLDSVGVKTIDTLMISHADNDHVGGAESILRKFNVNEVIASDEVHFDSQEVIACTAGQQWEWDGVRFSVLHPQPYSYYKKRNNRSCVLMVQAGEHKALLTGDIETLAEHELIEYYGAKLKADVMLVPHHGSKTSSSKEFIQIVQPEYALIPVGYRNQYGHPKERVLQRYKDQNIQILRTEQDGAISLRLGGELLPSRYRKDQQRFWLN